MADAAILGILEQNILYMFSALRPLEQGSVHAYCALVRPVLESVHKCFFLMKHPESTKKFLLSETYDAWKRTQQYEKSPATPQAFLESDAAQWALRGRKITPDEFNKFRDNHTNYRIRAKIYETDTLRHQHSFYSMLNTSSHANILRSLEDTALSEDRAMKVLTDLSFFNLFLMFNSQYKTLCELGLMEEAKRFIVDAQQSLKVHLGVTSLYPDKKGYSDILVLAPRRKKRSRRRGSLPARDRRRVTV